ncbi:hypothetical protein P7228_03225 [Altererythrobacter arenosus]|uniref:DUF2219 family protein n=1 Tax=Altererythrobacter arenosus TaxID=3032592 RepID=A0ABY8FTK4_9SPHN|nr:hypothetical protein [Altererythrobacter sp. CAU 1644]WFL78097.1 hypothetical protein P7228_03225 [Altererythrobacter sp. CAU 1644]
MPSRNPRTAAAHQLLYLAAMSNLPVPKFLGQGPITPTGPQAQPAKLEPRPRADRWSLDAWVFWREGSKAALASAGRIPSYGASQTAGVLRYRLAPASKHDPRGYFRAYRALVEGGEGELALGLSARPIGAIPVRAHAEVRATRFDRDWEARPAAFATTELAPVVLTRSLRAETYLQGGFVGGRNSTPFADGQVHVIGDVVESETARFSLGAAAWGGAQDGTERLDVGPSLRLDLTIGEAPARFSLDWRERIAGDAMPDSGVALTLSTRF